MKEVNYNESVIIPLLQRKYQELMNSNLVLEANLLVEQAKNRDLAAKVEALEAKVGKKKKSGEPELDGSTF
jgi:hypothetical protein